MSAPTDWRQDNRIADVEHDALVRGAAERSRLDALLALCEKLFERLAASGIPVADLATELAELRKPLVKR